MRISSFGSGRRVAVLFRLCLATIVVLTLAVGGMALNPQPVQALTVIPAAHSDNVTECQYWEYQFTYTPTPACTTYVPLQHYHWWVVGALPPGLTLDQDGLLSGCPPLGASAGSPYNFTIGCTELACCCCPPGTCGPFFASSAVTLDVLPASPGTMTINPTFYPVAWEGMSFAMTLSATGCSGTYNWSATGLPAGLSVTDPVNGVISGIPAPGTCGSANVTATVSDPTVCPDDTCCPPVSRSFFLIVDCWANYIHYIIAIGTYAGNEFTVEIGPGLTQGLTNVSIDGSHEVTLGGNQLETFPTQPNQLHLVSVDQAISGPGTDTRFAVMGSNQIVVGGTHNTAYFDYEKQFLITTGSEPAGVSQPTGTDFYSMGSTFSTTARSPVQPGDQEGLKYVFSEWRLPDGSMQPNRDVGFNVNQGGHVTAFYDTYYELQLQSDYPPVNESSWELKDSTAEWDLALHAVPLQGLMGFLGGQLTPVNTSGTHSMTGPHTEEILWKKVYTIPIIAIVLILLVIAGLGYFAYRRKLGPTRPAPKKKAPAPKSKRGLQPKAKASSTATRTGAKKASSRTKPKVK